MRAAARKWAARRQLLEIKKVKEGTAAAGEWLLRFDQEKVRKHIYRKA